MIWLKKSLIVIKIMRLVSKQQCVANQQKSRYLKNVFKQDISYLNTQIIFITSLSNMARQLKQNTIQYPSLPCPSIRRKPTLCQSLTYMQDAARQQQQMLRQLYCYTSNSKKLEELHVHEQKLSIHQNEEIMIRTDYYSDHFQIKMEEEHFNIFVQHESESLFSAQNSQESSSYKSTENIEMLNSNEYQSYFSY